MRRGSVLATGMMPMTVGMQPPNAIMPSMECPAMRRRGLMGLPCTIGHRRHVRVGRCSFSMSSRKFPCKNCTIRHSQLKVLSLPRLGSVVIGTGRSCALTSCQGWKMQVQHVTKKNGLQKLGNFSGFDFEKCCFGMSFRSLTL